jgi:hypothetical protein
MDIVEMPVLALVFGLLAFAIIIVVLGGIWKVFEKAGRPGWEALIPIYNTYRLIKIAGKPGWWLLLAFIPILNFVITVWVLNMISKSFGKDEGFTIGLVLFGAIFFPILGFGSARYLGPYGDPVAFQAYQDKNKFDFEQ